MGSNNKVNPGVILLICLLFVVVIAMGVILIVNKADTDNKTSDNGGEYVDNDNTDVEKPLDDNVEKNNDNELEQNENTEANVNENTNANTQKPVEVMTESEMKSIFYTNIAKLEYVDILTSDEKETLWNSFLEEIKSDNVSITREYFNTKYDALKANIANTILQAKALKDAKEKVSDAREEMSNVTNKLKDQMFLTYDGKIVTGTDVLVALQVYQTSTDISIKVINSKTEEYDVGENKYSVPDSTRSSLNAPVTGGVKVTSVGKLNNSNAYNEAVANISKTNTYYASVMKDSETGNSVGVIFVKRGAGL